MAAEIRLPQLGVSMTEGTIAEWMVNSGDVVAEGTVIYRVETDKVENDIEAPVAGTIRLLASAGDVCEVGDLVAEIT